MAKAALTKVFILVILAFIICLPEFFSLYRVSKVQFLCQPYQPCERGSQTGEYGNSGDAEINRRDMCDPSQNPEHEKWERACTQHNQSNSTDLEINPRRGGEHPDIWLVCQTDKDMAELQSNMSSSALRVYLEVSVAFQLGDTALPSLTLYGHSNYSSLHLHLPEEEEKQNETGDEERKESFYCCLPVLPTSPSANQSRCLLWLANQTVLTAQEKLPWKRTQKGEWHCIVRVVWLGLVCVILLTIVTTVIRDIYWHTCSYKNPKVRPVDYKFAGQQLDGKTKRGEKSTETSPKDCGKAIGTLGTCQRLTVCGTQTWSGLSPIPEIQEDIEMLLDGTADNCNTAKLHHRGHLSTSLLTEEE